MMIYLRILEGIHLRIHLRILERVLERFYVFENRTIFDNYTGLSKGGNPNANALG